MTNRSLVPLLLALLVLLTAPEAMARGANPQRHLMGGMGKGKGGPSRSKPADPAVRPKNIPPGRALISNSADSTSEALAQRTFPGANPQRHLMGGMGKGKGGPSRSKPADPAVRPKNIPPGRALISNSADSTSEALAQRTFRGANPQRYLMGGMGKGKGGRSKPSRHPPNPLRALMSKSADSGSGTAMSAKSASGSGTAMSAMSAKSASGGSGGSGTAMSAKSASGSGTMASKKSGSGSTDSMSMRRH